MGFSHRSPIIIGAMASLSLVSPLVPSPVPAPVMRSGWMSAPAKKKRRSKAQIKRAKAQKAQRLARRKNR